MDTAQAFNLSINKEFNEEELLKGIYIVVVHANRIPPHIGLIIDKYYHSLTVKGQDINIPLPVLLKNITQRKTPTLFIKIKNHHTFSNLYLREHLITNIKQFPRVDIGIATCLSPLKLFFEEVYGIQMNSIHFLYELLPKLNSEHLIEHSSSLFINNELYKLPLYTDKEVNEGIEQVRNEFKGNSFVKH